MGNHEFDEGTDNLALFIEKIDFPLLIANMDVSNDTGLSHIKLEPSLVVEVDGRKVGIIGYLTPLTKLLSTGIYVEFSDEIEAIK